MTEQTARPCPICKRPEDARLRPFCSKRCADVDLSRWLKGSYAIPAEEAVPDVIEDDQ
ncbi:MAG: DNA gyrase inhibitor YacG [Alphaproteobacteria bacterium]|nr:DNA gyrase inhibitor YacG [Alphaproteobacteria bacterium]